MELHHLKHARLLAAHCYWWTGIALTKKFRPGREVSEAEPQILNSEGHAVLQAWKHLHTLPLFQ